jgi:hypothetical protein
MFSAWRFGAGHSGEEAMFAGLPWDIHPTRTADGRYTVNLPGDIRLDVNHHQRTALLINPAGTLLHLSLSRIEAFGEHLQTHLIPDGGKSFAAEESLHRGLIASTGEIHLSLSTGLDLHIRFPEPASDAPDAPVQDNFINCRERRP